MRRKILKDVREKFYYKTKDKTKFIESLTEAGYSLPNAKGCWTMSKYKRRK